MTVTWRDLWIRRQRAARRNRFNLAHALNAAAWADDEIEWREIASESLVRRQQIDAAKDPLKLEQAKRNRLRALEF